MIQLPFIAIVYSIYIGIVRAPAEMFSKVDELREQCEIMLIQRLLLKPS